MIELIVKRDDREINRYFLPQGATTLGRAEDNAIILDDAAVSRRHAQIRVDGSRVSIQDMGSGNGTFFGDERLEGAQELGNGDVVVIEPFQLLLRVDREGVGKDSTRPVPASRPAPSTRLDAPPSRAKREAGGSAAGGPRLEVVRGQGGPYLLTGENASIGRSEEATITLKDPSSSRKHAAIERTNRGWTITDLGSANGTYLNGASVKGAALQDGDIILIGNTELRFVEPMVLAEAEDPEPPPPPASTRPVASRAPGGRKPSPPPPAPSGMEMELSGFEDDPGTAGNGNGYGGHGGGALPQDADASGGTEFGPPPSAWDNGEGTEDGGYQPAFGDRPTGFNDPDTGGFSGGMELGDDALFPGGQRPPDSLVGRYIYSLKTDRKTQLLTFAGAFVFVIILASGNRDGGSAGSGALTCLTEEELDKEQSIGLNTIERFEKEAEAALAMQPRDYATAFDRYQRLATFGRRDTMANVCVAQDKTRIAVESLYALHEFLMIQRLGEVTRAGAQKDAATQARIERNARDGRAALAVAKRRRDPGQYRKAIEHFENLLKDDPVDAEAKGLLEEARRELRAIQGEMGAAQLQRLNNQCMGVYNQGLAQQGKRSAAGYQQAIKTFERITKSLDPDGRTQYYQQAQTAITAAKRKLRELASPLREEGKKFAAQQNWIAARKAYRNAVATDPFDATLQSELGAVQDECIRSAKRQLSEAKAYEAAYNYQEALKALDLALKYADRDSDRENFQAKEIMKRIRRNSER